MRRKGASLSVPHPALGRIADVPTQGKAAPVTPWPQNKIDAHDNRPTTHWSRGSKPPMRKPLRLGSRQPSPSCRRAGSGVWAPRASADARIGPWARPLNREAQRLCPQQSRVEFWLPGMSVSLPPCPARSSVALTEACSAARGLCCCSQHGGRKNPRSLTIKRVVTRKRTARGWGSRVPDQRQRQSQGYYSAQNC